MLALDALVLSLPTRNPALRMRVWRALKDSGCGVLRDGVYVLPEGNAVLGRMESEIRAGGGFAMAVQLKLRTEEQHAHARALFDRGAGYGELARRIAATKGSLARLGPRKARTAVERLKRSFDKLSGIDFFPGRARAQAADALAALQRDLADVRAPGEPHASGKRPRRLDPARYRKRVWATRKDLWIDRLASAWLIRRFIDREARFVWVDSPRHRPKRAVGFDFDGAEFTHVGPRVTFEVLVASFGLEGDAALGAIGSAVRYLDVGGIPVADAKGLETLLTGVREKTADDDARLSESIRIFDLLYSAYGKKA